MGNSNVCGDSEKPLLSSFELHSFGSIFSPHFIVLIDYFAFSELISTGKESDARQLKKLVWDKTFTKNNPLKETKYKDNQGQYTFCKL